MPALDYVSVIRSVYADRGAMLAGAFASAFAAGISAFHTNSIALYIFALAFIVIGLLRYLNMRAFWLAAIDSDDALAAEAWENRAVAIGSALALVYGLWCLVSMLVVRDPYAELVSSTLTIAVMVGICTRNFGLDRLVTLQMALVISPLSLGLLLRNDVYHPVLAILLIVMLSSFRKLAGDIRSLLLSAVHGRVEASRLAAELDMAMATLEHGLCMLDERGVISVANERAIRLFAELGQPNLIGQPFGSVLADLTDSTMLPRTAVDRLADLISTRAPGKVLLCFGEDRYLEVTVSARKERCVLLFEDISERVSAEEKINFMARHDALTQLPNRTYFGDLASEDLLERQRPEAAERLVSLTLIDIDDFKHVNDTLGHMVGDKLLVEVSRRLRQALPVDSVLARLGGDEFVVYRGDAGDERRVEQDCTAILQAFAEPFVLEELTLTATVSLGIALSVDREEALDTLLTKADLALYSAKGDGKARSQVFHAQMDVDYHYRQRLKADLRSAVQSDGLSLAFQPLLDIQSRKVVACEALARWDHPELGPIAPSVFIPLAEEIGLISDITAWVLRRATLQCSQWPDDVAVAINISARDFRVRDLNDLVDSALAFSGLTPDRLEIEVTETAVIEEREIAQRVLSDFSKRGIGIALDDFGTGYSALSYLHALPFTKLKIDQSFVGDIEHNERSRRLLANVAKLGRDLELTVVAEGVETEAQCNLIRTGTEIQQVQGYYFSRPVPEQQIGCVIEHLNSGLDAGEANLRCG
ncbi:MAG TPA: EAL domain-containing protein [Devosia sp.]|jgi:diguanylate cyclase (GGDEF)-like protein|uniref:putative bifunctional diguanylate cyclase/phosphodiesterase n=1 Tax=Devosia sp. TaxID=1871048 RepID=UPI002F92A954